MLILPFPDAPSPCFTFISYENIGVSCELCLGNKMAASTYTLYYGLYIMTVLVAPAMTD